VRAFDYARPTSLDEAVRLAARDDVRLLSGGTDLVVGLRHGTVTPALVVDLKGVPDLTGEVEVFDTTIRIPAGVVMSRLVENPVIRAELPALVEAMNTVGSIQIRNRATLGGNICNASPAADTVPPLLVHDTVVHVAGPDGPRRCPLAEFVIGPRRTDLRPGEIVVAVDIGRPRRPTGTSFRRMTRRRGVDLATVSLCCSVDSSGPARFAFGAVAPVPFLVCDQTGALTDLRASAQAKADALDVLVAQASPITDVRGSSEYRLAMLRVLGLRALAEARRRLDEATARDHAPAKEDRA
jgi:CO/xanthine dehydrogenase FAD-binding subunit